MKFSLTINCDNAAFEGACHEEIARILRKLAHSLEEEQFLSSFYGRKLIDTDGNDAGQVTIVEDDNVRYQVLDNGKPASYPRAKIWNRHTYLTFEEACKYAYLWLGPYGGDENSRPALRVNEPYDYNGHGDTIEIRAIPA